jgi:hypothetical protein
MKIITAFAFDLAAQRLNCAGYFSSKADGRSIRREADRRRRKIAKKQATGRTV